jgi:hypothetical protein
MSDPNEVRFRFPFQVVVLAVEGRNVITGDMVYDKVTRPINTLRELGDLREEINDSEFAPEGALVESSRLPICDQLFAQLAETVGLIVGDPEDDTHGV